MHQLLAVFANDSTTLDVAHPRPERLVEGNSLHTSWNRFDRDGMSAGLWACEPGAWRIAFADDTDEFLHVLSGRIRIIDEGGLAREFAPGEACVTPAGLTGVFEVLEAVRKHYVFVKRGDMS